MCTVWTGKNTLKFTHKRTGFLHTVLSSDRRKNVKSPMLLFRDGQEKHCCIVESMKAIWNEIKHSDPCHTSCYIHKSNQFSQETRGDKKLITELWKINTIISRRRTLPRQTVVTQMTQNWIYDDKLLDYCQPVKGVNRNERVREQTCSKNSSIKPFSIPTATSSSSSVVSFPWTNTHTCRNYLTCD